MNKRIILIIFILLIAAGGIYLYLNTANYNSHVENHWDDDVGSVDKIIYGNPNSTTEIVLVLGIHPREKLAIEPELESAKQFAAHHDVKLVVYYVNVTQNADDYQQSRNNGEHLVKEYVVPDIEKSNAKAVIISHSHIEGYGEGFYLATPAMDNASVKIAEEIADKSDFNYFPTNTSQPLKASSAILISKPLADAGYPTFVYEIPEDITEQDSTSKGIALLELIFNIVKN